jgi:hypothetical protein
VIQTRLVNFQEETGREHVTFDVGNTTKCMRIIELGQIGEVPNHGEADPAQIDRSDAEGLKEAIAFNIV